ncbi:E3 ubiquitin-protein ligase TRIM35-like [Gadus macrocephalus]|uniref:E3 ubiquitin-protein ligase TRIM35-like n=1 Tax=Gadus macrocephalus TaxID=80720 RepID=UPI0028CBACF8|nr:E3 ubiquitin-protein ligase TRIM35-like [Gadus macrocephalus]
MADITPLVNDLSCSVCHYIFNDPVILSCSHRFCKGCLQSWWMQSQEHLCPLCKRRSSKTEPPRNIALKNLSEAFQRGNADLCPLHGEKLELFCLDDLETACLICRDSEKHANHRFLPVDEAAPSHRKEIQELFKSQKVKLNDFVETKRKCDQIAAHIKVQTAHTERQIQKEFEKLHQFLQDEEKFRITALRDEEQMKGQKIKKKIEELSMQIETISQTVTETEQQLGAGDVSFLKKATAEKAGQPRPSPALPEGALLDVAKHLGNLAYAVLKKLEDNVSYFPVILDPNTAAPDLHLSDDLTSVRCGARQQLPENPERLVYGVLGSRSLESGTCTWEVEVGDSAHWELGVSNGIYRKSGIETISLNSFLFNLFGPDCFKIVFHKGRYRSQKGTQSVDLPAMQKLQRIRMTWDPTTHEMSFSDFKTNHKMRGQLSLSLLLPFFHSTDAVPLSICPGKNLPGS